MKHISRIVLAVVGLLPVVGCMTSRSYCNVTFENLNTVISSSAAVNTANKYKIREIRVSQSASARDDSIMRRVTGSLNAIERIMHTCPGVFENDGEEIIIDIISHNRDSNYVWTWIPCFLTVGICPYFQHDDTEVMAEVSLISNPSKKARFSYSQVDDWKVSFLFQLGSIPYSEEILERSRIGKKGAGDVAIDVHREGFAVGVAKALKEIEKN